MNILCISTSNTVTLGKKSRSNQTAELIGDIIHRDYGKHHQVKVLPLMEHDLEPCKICTKCVKDSICVFDSDFNDVFEEIKKADRVFFVVPHYSPIPSKLVILFEKMNQVMFSHYMFDKTYQIPTLHKPMGIIAHGGMVENDKVLNHYYEVLVKPVSTALRSLGFKAIGVSEDQPYGVTYGVKDDKRIVEGNDIWPEVHHDWQAIEERITPLVKNVMEYEEENVQNAAS